MAFTGDGWLRTGDLGRIDEDGYLYITGRRKDVIISGGENVSAAEVESVLNKHPAVREAAVFGIPDPRWQEVPMAVVVPGPGFDADDVLTFAREKLARFQTPAGIRPARTLPHNATGKVDKGRCGARTPVRLSVCRCNRATERDRHWPPRVPRPRVRRTASRVSSLSPPPVRGCPLRTGSERNC
jgi:acyl-CoA synthetase (AMP-forming)/AMP-acid ligase II